MNKDPVVTPGSLPGEPVEPADVVAHRRMQYSGMPVRTVIERGPKGKRCVAFAIDWPGWSRGAKSAELALEMLESHRDRYRPVARLAGMALEFDAAGPLETVEDRVGT
ncbi:MAG: hypothetical protein ACXWWQ_08580, partial [Candidatus Limnocylindria bacterium]